MRARVASWLACGTSLLAASCGLESHELLALREPAVESDQSPARGSPPGVPSNRLSALNIYEDMEEGSISKAAIEFVPDYPLWSDGVVKRRWIILPESTQIDTHDMEHWRYPLGTIVVKEFSIDGVRLETRVVEKVAETGRLKKDISLRTYVWNDAQTEAVLTQDGVVDVLSTTHNVPKQKLCITCHGGEPGGVLGFSALQLSESGTLKKLAKRGLFSDPPTKSYRIPGNDVERQAIGYLHANCGHCHTEGTRTDFMRMRVLLNELDLPLTEWQLYKTSVDQDLVKWSTRPEQFTKRIVPGDAEASAVFVRMNQRDTEESQDQQMPPLATELIDVQAVSLVRSWIDGMSQRDVDAGSADAGNDADADIDAETSADAEPDTDAGIDASAETMAPP